jgi:hypothetical protein
LDQGLPDNVPWKGFNLIVLDTTTCKASNYQHFDTNAVAADSDKLAAYINGLPDGTHILGVTCDEASYSLQNSANVALKSIGVDVTGLASRDKVLFHAIKGQPEKTFARIGKAGGGSIYYDEKAACEVCKNGGVLKANDDGNGLVCQCTSGKFIGLYCDKIRPECL